VLDRDLNEPGQQYECSVSDVQRYGQPDQAEQPISECNAAATDLPCWRIISDSSCESDPTLALEVVRGTPPPQDSNVVAYCLACLADWYGGT
jgi:hypothetical protein